MAGNKEVNNSTGKSKTSRDLFSQLGGMLIGDLLPGYLEPFGQQFVSYTASGSAKSGKDGTVDQKAIVADIVNVMGPAVLESLLGQFPFAGQIASSIMSEMDIGGALLNGLEGFSITEAVMDGLDVGWALAAAGAAKLVSPNMTLKEMGRVFTITLALDLGHKGVDLSTDLYQFLGVLPSDEELAAMEEFYASLEGLRNAPQAEKEELYDMASSMPSGYNPFGGSPTPGQPLAGLGDLSFLHGELPSFADGMSSGGQNISTLLTEGVFKDAFTFIPEQFKAMGNQSIAGFCQGFEAGNPEFGKVVEGCVGITEETLDSHSPSRVFMRLGEYSAEGFIEGLSSVIGDTGKVAADVVGAMDGELSTFSSTTGNTSSEDAGTGEGDSSGWLSEFGAAISGGITQMSGLFSSVSSINAILNPMSTIMTAMMEVLEPVINEVLSPLVGILTTVGTLFGNVLAPALQIITPIIRIVAEGFVWLYNKILVPIGNGFITVFNAIYNAVAWVYNKVAWLWGGRLETRDLNAGHLQAISTDGLTQSGASYTGAGGSGSTGSSTSVNSYKIEVYQTIEGNVIGDGGMAAIGEFFVQAVQEYYGSGGKISLVMAAK